jgi:hypothetical protein
VSDRIIQGLVYSLTTDEKPLVKGLDTADKKVGQLEKSTTGLTASTQKTTDAFNGLNKILGAAGIGLSISAAIAFIKQSVIAFADAERAVTTLDMALKMRGMESSGAALKEYATQLQKLGVADDDLVIKLEAELVASGRSEAQIRSLIQASAGLSAVTGDSLDVSLEQLNKTLTGIAPRTAALKAVMGELTEEQLKNGEGIQRVIENYSSFIGKTGETSISLNQLKFAINDLSEAFGKEFAEGIKVSAPYLVEFADAIAGLIPRLAQGYKEFVQLKGVWSLLGFILAPISAALAGIGGALQTVSAVLRGDLPGALNRLEKTGLDVLEGLTNPTKEVINLAITGLNKILSGISKVTGKKIALVPKFEFFGLSLFIDKQQARLDKAYEDMQKKTKALGKSGADAFSGQTKAAKELTEEQKKQLETIKSIIEASKTEYQKITDQIAALEAIKTTTNEAEESRLQAIAILKNKLYDLDSVEIKKANEDAISGEEAKKQATIDATNEMNASNDKYFKDAAGRRAKEAKDQEDLNAMTLANVKQMMNIAKAFSDAMQTSISEGWDELTLSVLDSTAAMAQAAGDTTTAGILSVVSGAIEIVSSWIDYAKNVELDFAATTNDVNKSILDNKIKLVDEELKITLSRIDAEEKAALKAAGFIEDTEVEALQKKLALETDEEAKAELEKAIAKATIEEEYQARRDAANAAAEKEKRRLEHERALWEREIMLAKIAIDEEKAISELGWFNQDKKDAVRALYSDLRSSVNAIPIPALAQGGSFIVPPGFEQDSFPIAMAQSGERVTVETPEQQETNGGIHLHIGTFIGDDSSYRELGRKLTSLGGIEILRRG